jgi:CDP-diacylglycerol--glycerol-3-phosphate 3-phosphatidyltransferase
MFVAFTSLWPAFILITYFVGALGIYALRNVPIDSEVQTRPDSPMLSRFFRNFLMWLLAPWQRLLVRSRVTPNMLTAGSLLCAFGAAAALAFNRVGTAGWLYLLCGILDTLDGRVARSKSLVSPSGAFFDSVIDRYAELAVFGGLAYFYRESWALVLVLLASLGSVMVSYSRARGEALGVTHLNIGLMQRPERLFYLGLSMVVGPFVETLFGHGSLPPYLSVLLGLFLLAVSSNLTAIRRIRYTMARLDGESEKTLAAPSLRPSTSPAPLVTALRMVDGRRAS